jgi:hypothetical protein
MGNSNFTASLSKGISCVCLWECFLVVDFELVFEEEEEYYGEGGGGGGLGESYPSSLLSCLEYSPWKGLFYSK